MFDNLIINTDKLPITDKEKKLVNKNPNWQTKDFDCQLTEIYITDEDELKINRFEYEEVPKHERPYPNEDGLRGLMGSVKRINERLEPIYYSGELNFYSHVGNDWYEFFAQFNNGKLISIRGGKQSNN